MTDLKVYKNGKLVPKDKRQKVIIEKIVIKKRFFKIKIIFFVL